MTRSLQILSWVAVAPIAVVAVAQVRTDLGDNSTPPVWSWRVTYIANEGVLLGKGENSVLIDALFGDGVAGYDRLDRFRQDFLEKGGNPFDQVALVLVTHKHADHFDARAVARFMKENKTAVFASCRQVVKLLTFEVADDPDVRGRIRTVDPQGHNKVELSVGALKVEVLYLSHGDGRRSGVTNLGFIVHMGDKRVLHVGDAQLVEATREPLKRHAAGVDAACVPYWWLLEEDGRAFLRDTLKVSRVIALHIPPAQSDEIYAKLREADKTYAVLRRFAQSALFGT